MAELEQAHRHAMEESVADKTFAERRLGQHYGLAIGIISVVAGVISVALGAQIPGAVIGGGGVVGLVAVFVYGRRQNGQNEQPKPPNRQVSSGPSPSAKQGGDPPGARRTSASRSTSKTK